MLYQNRGSPLVQRAARATPTALLETLLRGFRSLQCLFGQRSPATLGEARAGSADAIDLALRLARLALALFKPNGVVAAQGVRSGRAGDSHAPRNFPSS